MRITTLCFRYLALFPQTGSNDAHAQEKRIRLSSIVLIILGLFLLSGGTTLAQDAASVRTAIERHYAAIHAREMTKVWEHHLPDFTWFSSDGRLLMEAGTAEASARMGAKLDFGTANVYMSHFNVQMYGKVAVATFYLVGTHTSAGKTKNGTWRVSAVWVRKGDKWKEAHHHESPLKGEIRFAKNPLPSRLQKKSIQDSAVRKKKITKTYTNNPVAYQAYLKGRFHWNRRTVEGLYLAQDTNLDRNVAIKFLNEKYSEGKENSRDILLQPTTIDSNV